MKVVIESITIDGGQWSDMQEAVKVLVDDEEIGTYYYGGEPEDNARYRDYYWIEPLLMSLAKKLGAEVEIINKDKY